MLRRNTDAAVELIGAGEYEAAARVLGTVLHAWQDLAAHSDIAFLTDDQRAGIDDGTSSFTLRITSYDRLAEDPERPRDPLEYTHADFALDHPRKNAFARGNAPGTEAPRFDLAVRAATMFTRQSIASIAGTVSRRYSEEAWQAFLAHNASRTNGLWFSALLVEDDGAHGGVRIARSITHLFPAFQPAFTVFTDGEVRVGFQIGLGTLGPRITMFAGLDLDVSEGGLAYGAGATIRAAEHAWLPDILVAGDSDRRLLAGLSARF
jgi:hypothetical protein